MGIITQIRNIIGGFFMRREVSKLNRDRKAFSLEEAKTFGIIFDSSTKEDFELVKKYVNYLKEMKKKVKVIGYFSARNIPEVTYPKLEYDFFTTKELNWYNKPANKFVGNFIEEEYDVLIDLNIHERFPLKYIGATSRARFKVGRYAEENKEIYDLLIESEESKSMKYFLRQVDTYLAMINNRAPQAN